MPQNRNLGCQIHPSDAIQSQKTQGNVRTCFSISQRMMVIIKTVSTCRRHRMQLVVGKLPAEHPARSATCTIEPVIGPRHTEQRQTSTQTPLVKRRIVRHQRQRLDSLRDLWPHRPEVGRGGRINRRQTMHLRTEPAVIVRDGADQPVDGVDDTPSLHNHHADRADAGPLAVGRFEINSRKISHLLQRYEKKADFPPRRKSANTWLAGVSIISPRQQPRPEPRSCSCRTGQRTRSCSCHTERRTQP